MDEELELLYVADTGNNRITVFEADGTFVKAFGWGVVDGSPELQTCTTVCQQGISGNGDGQFAQPRFLAVDDDAASPSHHMLYVSTGFRVQKFDPAGLTGKAEFLLAWGSEGKGASQFSDRSNPLTVAGDGDVLVGDSPYVNQFENEGFANRVERFDSSGALKQEFVAGGSKGRISAVAVSSIGEVFVTAQGLTDLVFKYGPAGEPLSTFSVENPTALAMGPADNLFVSKLSSGDPRTVSITEYAADDTPKSVFFPKLSSGPFAAGVAVFSSGGGDVFISEGGDGQVLYIPFPPPGPLLPPDSAHASVTHSVKATLTGAINPEGKETTFHIQYVDQQNFENGDFANAATITTPESPSIGADFSTHSVSLDIGCQDAVAEEPICLRPGTKYHFRVVATNENGVVVGEDSIFETLPPLLAETYATDVGSDSTRLIAKVNPYGVAATGYVQYVDDATFQVSGFESALSTPDVPNGTQPIDFGAGENPVLRSVPLSSLAPGTKYHFRFSVTDRYTTVIVEGSFTTYPPSSGSSESCPNQVFRTGPSAALPDCRAYELVSPLDKNNGDIYAVPDLTRNPTALVQSASSGDGLTYTSFRAFASPQSAPYASQYLASRGGGGWSTQSLAPPRDGNPIFGNNSLEPEFKAFTSELDKSWIFRDVDPVLDPRAPEGFADLYQRDTTGGSYRALSFVKPKRAASDFKPELQGFSADGEIAVFRVNDKLTPNAVSGKSIQVYRASGEGVLHLVSILPDGSVSPQDATVGTANFPDNPSGRSANVTHAVSKDGSKVYWTSLPSGQDSAGQIYLRENADQPQSAITGGECSEQGKGCTVAVSATASVKLAHFLTASPNGDRAIFKSVDGSAPGGLYEFDAIAGESHMIAPQIVLGLLGASEDASRLYFASKAILTGANSEGKSPVPGRANLYFYDASKGGADRYRFLGTLVDADLSGYGSPLALNPSLHSGGVTPDGQSALFPSTASLTDYDNRAANGGKPAVELYLYEASAAGSLGELRCVSCNPSGARPVARQLEDLGPTGFWAAATVPKGLSQFYAQQVLSADGQRAFFTAYDSLALADTNGKADVYEWEAVGSGDCLQTANTYSASNGGCISLISSGQSSSDSEFLDASPSGADVFFTTLSGLLPQDYGLIDIYDAREGGGFPAPAGPLADCEGEACQGPLAAPDDSTPASATFRGAGNVRKDSSSRCKGGKARRKGRCVTRRKHAQKHGDHRGRAKNKGRATK